MNKRDVISKWSDAKPIFCNGKSRVAIYDFDATLFNSPDRETGEILYLEGMGKEWPFGGWWGRPESLEPPIIPNPPPAELLVESTIQFYRQDKLDKNSHLVLMTGRPIRSSRRIKEILDHFDLKFDEYFYRGMKGIGSGSDTLQIKLDIIKTRIVHDKLKVLEIYEDRPAHVSEFISELKKLRLEKLVVHDVVSGVHHEFNR